MKFKIGDIIKVVETLSKDDWMYLGHPATLYYVSIIDGDIYTVIPLDSPIQEFKDSMVPIRMHNSCEATFDLCSIIFRKEEL